jgi:hypothetical protein
VRAIETRFLLFASLEVLPALRILPSIRCGQVFLDAGADKSIPYRGISQHAAREYVRCRPETSEIEIVGRPDGWHQNIEPVSVA